MNKKNSGGLCQQIEPDIFRIRLPLPGEKPGPVNAYLFVGENITLLDTGVLGAWKVLQRALSELGYTFADVDQVVITHGHMDHYGAANRIVTAPGGHARVGVHEADRKRVETGADVSRKTYDRYIQLMGVPLAHRLGLRLMTRFFRSMAENCQVDFTLEDQEIITLGNYQGQIVFTPGHSKGSVCISLEKEGLLFSGDHILGHITPNAFVMLDDGAALPTRLSQREFYASMERIENLAPAVVYPAHSGEVKNLEQITGMYRKNFSERENQIMAIVDAGDFSIYQIARILFPGIGGRRLPLDIFLSISEVFTHLQVLQDKGRVDMFVEGNRVLIQAIKAS